MNPQIFKAYDIRGIFRSELNEDDAYKIGKAFSRFLPARHWPEPQAMAGGRGQSIVVGRDMRLSGRSLFEALARGITDAGKDVIDVGLVSTPMLYFAVAHYGYAGGVMITASHNPKEYNGFKLCREAAIPIYGEDIKRIGTMAEGLPGRPPAFGEDVKKGRVIPKEIMPDYRRHVLGFVEKIAGLKVVIDAGNSMAGHVIPELFRGLDLEIVKLYFELDGSFPNHAPNPLKSENTRDLQRKVREEGADLGIAFDGDADRVIFVDDRGQRVSADLITVLIGTKFLEKEPGSAIIYDLRSSRIVRESIEAKGGQPLISRVGHTFIKELMRSKDAIFGGELSGHYYFRDNFYADNADIATVELLNLITARQEKLSEMLEPFKIYFVSGEINSEVADKDAKLKEIERLYADGKISHLDGVLVEYEDWWFNLRKSNTEPLLRLNLEARTKEKMEECVRKLLAQIRR